MSVNEDMLRTEDIENSSLNKLGLSLLKPFMGICTATYGDSGTWINKQLDVFKAKLYSKDAFFCNAKYIFQTKK